MNITRVNLFQFHRNIAPSPKRYTHTDNKSNNLFRKLFLVNVIAEHCILIHTNHIEKISQSCCQFIKAITIKTKQLHENENNKTISCLNTVFHLYYCVQKVVMILPYKLLYTKIQYFSKLTVSKIRISYCFYCEMYYL